MMESISKLDRTTIQVPTSTVHKVTQVPNWNQAYQNLGAKACVTLTKSLLNMAVLQLMLNGFI